MEQNKSQKIMEEVVINGIKVKIELSKEEVENFPKRIESTKIIKDKNLEHISGTSIFF